MLLYQKKAGNSPVNPGGCPLVSTRRLAGDAEKTVFGVSGNPVGSLSYKISFDINVHLCYNRDGL